MNNYMNLECHMKFPSERSQFIIMMWIAFKWKDLSHHVVKLMSIKFKHETKYNLKFWDQ